MATKEARNRAVANFRHNHPEEWKQMHSAAQKRWYQKNRIHAIATHKSWRKKIREEVIQHYGSRCVCCGETEFVFLTMDHINGGGNQHRKTLRPGKGKASSLDLYRWIKNNDFPDDFQVLCWNCNHAKAFLGECPHVQEERRYGIGLAC